MKEIKEGREVVRDLIEIIAKHLVDEPDEVKVNMRRGDQTTVIEIMVAKPDIGKIIGKEGSMGAALRKILWAVAAKQGFRCVLEIID